MADPLTVALPPTDEVLRRVEELDTTAEKLMRLERHPDLPTEQRQALRGHLREMQAVRDSMMVRLQRELRHARKRVRRIVFTLKRVCAPRMRPRQYRPRRIRVARGPRKARAPDDPDPEPEPVAVAPLRAAA